MIHIFINRYLVGSLCLIPNNNYLLCSNYTTHSLSAFWILKTQHILSPSLTVNTLGQGPDLSGLSGPLGPNTGLCMCSILSKYLLKEGQLSNGDFLAQVYIIDSLRLWVTVAPEQGPVLIYLNIPWLTCVPGSLYSTQARLVCYANWLQCMGETGKWTETNRKLNFGIWPYLVAFSSINITKPPPVSIAGPRCLVAKINHDSFLPPVCTKKIN